MNGNGDWIADTAELRRRAQELALEKAAKLMEAFSTLSPEETRQLAHELQVHQIELEMQNDELRRTQAELEASRARYFNLYDLAPVGYLTVSEQGLILEANLTVAEMLDLVRGDLIRCPVTRFILAEDQDIYIQARRKSLSSGAVAKCEVRLLKKDRSTFWAHLAITANGDPSPVCRVAIGDITEHKQAQAQRDKLEVQNRQLQKLESLSRMAGAIAHHFNNKLMAVMMNVKMAMMGSIRSEDQIELLKAALASTRTAAEVSSLMLTYLGQTQCKSEALDLSLICRKSLPLLQASMTKGVAIEADLPSPGPAICANADQMQQVFTNLIANACEACSDGSGEIRLTVKRVASAEIPTEHRFPIDCEIAGNFYACLEVADTGIGIVPRDMDKLFEPFFSTKFTGRGLGLPVVLGIARGHQGVVTVESKPGRGSVFRVFLPLLQETVSVPPPPAGKLEDMKGAVLVVEDEPSLRNAVATAISSLGFKVLAASDGADALDVFRLHQSDIRLVLCDMTMPRMDGWGTMEALRKLAPGIPVILCSGYSQAQVMAGDHPEWPQAFMSKPYEFEKLEETIRQVLSAGCSSP